MTFGEQLYLILVLVVFLGFAAVLAGTTCYAGRAHSISGRQRPLPAPTPHH